VELAEKFCQIVELEPEKGVALLGLCLEMVRPGVVLGIFVEVAEKEFEVLIGAKVSGIVLRGIRDLFEREGGRDEKAVLTVARYIEASEEEVVVLAYRFLLAFGDPIPPMPESILVRHLENEELFQYACHFLATRAVIEPSVEVLRGCLRYHKKPMAWMIVIAIGRTVAGANFLIENIEWLEKGEENPKEVFRLAMVIAMTPGCPVRLAGLPQYLNFLRVCAQLADEELLAAIPVLIGRFQVDQELSQRLREVGFWETYFEGVGKTQNKEVNVNCMVLMDRFIRRGWIPEFAGFVRQLAKSLEIQELVKSALELLVVISNMQEGAQLIVELNMIQYFEKSGESEDYGQSTQRILSNIGRFSESGG
jgi:hypothetical protein